MPMDTEKQFQDERVPLIEYQPVPEFKDRDPFIPAQEVEPTPEEQVLIKIKL